MTVEPTGRVVGHEVLPKRWDERTSGTDLYSGDVTLPGLLIGRVLRSPHPHARIRSIDTSRARQLAGVHAVITAADFAADATYIHTGASYSDRRPLAGDVVRYIGEEIAAVAADTAEQAQRAVAAIDVRYRRLRAALTIDAARGRRAPRIHDRTGGERNVSSHLSGEWGVLAEGQAASTTSVDGTFFYPRVAHACMEPNTTLAWWHADTEQLELWTSTQSPWFIRTELAHVLRLDEAQVVCRDVAVGGSFGSKSKVSEHEVLASALSIATGRPVRLAYSREEEFAATKPRHAFRVHLTSSADASGRIRAFDTKLEVDNGAYNHFGPSVMKVGIHALGSIYRPDGVAWDARLVDTNLPPGGQFRGYGGPQMVFAIESQVDELAEKLGLDPIELRLKNANQPNTTTLSGSRLGSARLEACLTEVRDAIGWTEKRAAKRFGHGVGVACGMHGSGSFTRALANRSDAAVDLFADGRARVRFGGADAGTGQRTILAQIAAEELGLDADEVEVLMMDGEQTPYDMGAWSSRGTHMGGHAVEQAARELADLIRALAAAKLGDDRITLSGGYARSDNGEVAIGDLVGLSNDTIDGRLSHESSYVDPRMEPAYLGEHSPNISASYTFAAHAVEVEVDQITGRVRVLDYVAAHDIGHAINPTMVRGQIIGGAAQGIGAALGEELIHEGGRVVNPAYINYALPRAGDVAPIRVILIEGGEEAGPYGAKSVGEMPIIPPGPAIANAVYDAIGVRIRDLPITPDKVLRALAAQRRQTRRYHLLRRPSRWWIEVLRRAYPLGVHFVLHRYGTRFARGPRSGPVDAVVGPRTVEEASRRHTTDSVFAGGSTDLSLQRRQGLVAPRVIIQLGGIAELGQIARAADGALEIGAGVTLATLASELRGQLPAIAEAVDSIASEQIREVATVGGNLVQAKRCWFFRNGFNCYKRGGVTCPCYAVEGDHRFYHAAIDGHRCQAVTPSDLATVFAAFDAQVVLARSDAERMVSIEQFYTGPGETILVAGELVKAIRIPAAALSRCCVFDKLQLWDGDFAVVSAAVSAQVANGGLDDVRVVLGAVAPKPWRAHETERWLAQARQARPARPVDVDRLRAVLDREFGEHAHPLPGNAWKLDAALGMVIRATGELTRIAERPIAARSISS